MNSREFVEIVRKRAAESAAQSTLEIVEAPVGNPQIDQWQVASHWYQQLDTQSKDSLRFLIGEAAKSAVFGFLCILDGVRMVSHEQTPPINGEFVLEFRTSQGSERLNAGWIDGPFLHDLM